MSKLIVPTGYRPVLSLYETQTAIGRMKRFFEDSLAAALNLKRVSAPLFVEPHTGLNDDLDGVEKPVSFIVKETGEVAQIVHSLAKWKRMALHNYKFPMGEGLYTDMNAIRRDDVMDNLHSIYVDQWDWERVIAPEERNEATLKAVVRAIAEAVVDTEEDLRTGYPVLDERGPLGSPNETRLRKDVFFITAQELEDIYPEVSAKERENAVTREHKTVFLMQIGGALRSGRPHDSRAPDYDDWQINGDLLYWSGTLGCAVEVSSMGVRVDPTVLDEQLKKAGCDHRRGLTYHKMLLAGELPLTVGGGIGQSRLSLLMLQKAHIGEVQVTVWDEATRRGCAAAGIPLL
jgi:aspartate--ammonia ligase